MPLQAAPQGPASPRGALPAGPDLAAARAALARLQAQAAARGLSLRSPPPEPATCCGRGCNGCVWEGYFDAVGFWCEDAQEVLGRPSVE